MSVMVHRLELPWNTLHWEDRQFRWLQLGLLSAALLLGWVVSVRNNFV